MNGAVRCHSREWTEVVCEKYKIMAPYPLPTVAFLVSSRVRCAMASPMVAAVAVFPIPGVKRSEGLQDDADARHPWLGKGMSAENKTRRVRKRYIVETVWVRWQKN